MKKPTEGGISLRRRKGSSPGEETIGLEEDLAQETGGCSPGEESMRRTNNNKNNYSLPGACAIGGAGCVIVVSVKIMFVRQRQIGGDTERENPCPTSAAVRVRMRRIQVVLLRRRSASAKSGRILYSLSDVVVGGRRIGVGRRKILVRHGEVSVVVRAVARRRRRKRASLLGRLVTAGDRLLTYGRHVTTSARRPGSKWR